MSRSRIQTENLPLTLMGMSGSGKSFWSKKLAEKGYKLICCDDRIEEKLAPELKKLGYKGLQDMAKWLGQANETQFSRNQQKYLDLEIETMEEILQDLSRDKSQKLVIDTTGSVIYTGEEICRQLGQSTKIIYLDTSYSVQQEMFQQFLKDPKPLIWGDLFSIMPNESHLEALKRCYPRLLIFRQNLYKTYAHQTIPYSIHKNPDMTVEDFLEIIG